MKRQNLIASRANPAGEEEVRSTPLQSDRFEVCPLFRDLLPRSPDEDARLEALLLVEGCRDALVVWQSRRLLVDGHQRYAFCSLLGRPFRVEYKEFADEQAACDYIWELHYGRRSYNQMQKSLVRARRYTALRQQQGGDRRSERSKCKLSTLKGTAALVARQFQVDRKTIYNDVRFARTCEQIAAACGEDVVRVILSGKISGTRRSYLQRLAARGADEQKRIVAEAVEQGKWPKLAAKDGLASKQVSLPRGKPKAQAGQLIRVLGARQQGGWPRP